MFASPSVMRWIFLAALLLQSVLVFAEEASEIGITEQVDKVVSADLVFKDEAGQSRSLRELFLPGKPVFLLMVYYECPNLCHLLLNGFLSSLKLLDWTVGDQFQVITVSIDPTEDAALASEKKKNFLDAYGRKILPQGWYFLTGEKPAIEKLAREVGFGYRYDAESREYIHASAVITLTPDGQVIRYLHGVEFKPQDLKLALQESAKIPNLTWEERIAYWGYHYDSNSRRYVVSFGKVINVAGVLTVLGLWFLIRQLSNRFQK